jgi:hypothetical protein
VSEALQADGSLSADSACEVLRHGYRTSFAQHVTQGGLALAASAALAGAYCTHMTLSQGVPPADWSERIRAGWVGKLAGGPGALPTEMWHKDQIRRKYGELSAPPQTPAARGPLGDKTLAVLGWQAVREHGPSFTSADIAAEWVEHLPETELQGGGFGREFLEVLRRLRQGEAPRTKATPVSTQAEPRAATRTGKFTLMALGDNSLGDLENLAQRYDLMVVCHSVGRDVIEAFRRANPGALVLCYLNTSDVNSDWASDPYDARLWDDINPHEDWFHHNANGDRVRIYFPKYKNRCAFDTGNADLQRYLAGRAVETLETGLCDGIQLDSVSTEFAFKAGLVRTWIAAVPADLTREHCTANEVALLTTIMAAPAEAGFAATVRHACWR